MADETKHSHGMYVRQRPKSHPLSQHQLDLVEASASCGIKKGITRDELVDKMVNCVPEAYRKLKEEREHGTESD